MANQDQIYKGPTNTQMTELIRYPTQTRPHVVIKQITADLQLSQEG